MARLSNVVGWTLAGGLFALQVWLFKAFSIDDAFITFRYVRQLVAGNGLVFNIGERVEGYSNFLWVMMLAPLHALGGDMWLAARVLGVSAGAATLILTYHLARAAPQPALAPLLLSACAPFVAWTMGGLETALFCLLLTAGTLAFVREEEREMGWASGWLFGLLALTRPEGVIFFVLAAGFRAWQIRRDAQSGTPVRLAVKHRDRQRLIAFGAVFLPYFVWRLVYYGQLLPNTVYAKSMGLHPRALVEGAYYLFDSVNALGGIWFLVVPLTLLALNRPSLRHRFLFACVFAYAGFVLVGGGDWMPLHRFLVHVLPLLIVLVHAGVMQFDRLLGRTRPHLVGLGLVLAQTAFLYMGALDARFVRGIGQPVTPQGQTMADYLRERWRPGDVVALTDAGGLAYALPLEARVVDMFGLTDAHIAHRRPQFPSGLFGRGDGFGKWDVDYVLAQNPRFVQLHVIARSPEGTFIVDNTSNRLLVNDPRFRLRYRQVADTPELQGLFERIE